MHAWKTQGFYTSWAWNLLGLSFLLGGTVPLLAAAGREDVLQHHPWILRAALISFEVAAPSAFLTSFIVAYALWPQAYRSHGPEGTAGFKGWINLLQHDGNSAMVLAEVCLMGGLPVRLGHAAFAPLFAGAYQAFLWFMLHRWSPGHGPVVPYFFMDTTLGARTTVFMVVLLAVIGLFFALFAVLDMGMAMIEHGDHGVVPNIFLCRDHVLSVDEIQRLRMFIGTLQSLLRSARSKGLPSLSPEILVYSLLAILTLHGLQESQRIKGQQEYCIACANERSSKARIKGEAWIVSQFF